MGTLEKLWIIARACLIASALGLMTSMSAAAQNIPNSNITATTNLPKQTRWPIEHIIDAKTADTPPFNGFTSNARTGTISFAFNTPYDVSGFTLWNDINVRAEGVESFRLDFKRSGTLVDETATLRTNSGQTEPHHYNFPAVKNVDAVDLVILSSIDSPNPSHTINRIEIREVAFKGVVTSPTGINTASATGSAALNMPSFLNNILHWVGKKSGFSHRTNAILLGVTALTAMGLTGLGALRLLRGKNIPRPDTKARGTSAPLSRPRKSSLKRPKNAGAIFAGSMMPAANVAAPLSAAPLSASGQLTASQLQMLNGPYTVLRPAYQATGRIGFEQEGKPTSEDYSFGTGFLITPCHVLTNRHVDGFYGHYLRGEDCGGIEFIAERDKDASDFIPFDGSDPYLVPGLDVAIYTLSREAKNRTPIAQPDIHTQSLEGREVVVIGYPDTHEPNNPDILAVVEDDPIFAVKRISQGHIFRHSSDEDDPLGVTVSVDITDSKSMPMSAICHNASTLGGNSGSPILDIETGELLGVHFAGYKIFNKKEAANLGMAVALLRTNISPRKLGNKIPIA